MEKQAMPVDVDPSGLSPLVDPTFMGVTWRQLGCIFCLLVLIAGARAYHSKDFVTALKAGLCSFRSVMVTVFACGVFMVVGPALMMLNKYIMEDLHFHHPIALCSIGLVSSTVVSHILVVLRLGEVREESWRLVSGCGWFHVAGPIGLMKALTMSTGNAVYLHLSFGFIQMLKAFTPLIVLIVMRAAGVKLPTRAAMWCVNAIVVGTLVEVRGELKATAFGLALMLSSELFEALAVVLSQKILQNNKFSVLEGMYITAPAGAICLVAGVVTMELPDILAKDHQRIPLEHPRPFLFAALLGVAINFMSFWVMQLTSALTMKILNTARSVGLVVVGVVFYGEEHPAFQIAGYAVALIGFAGYNFFQLFPEAARAAESRVDSTWPSCWCCQSKRLYLPA